jgi:hypothetical protein
MTDTQIFLFLVMPFLVVLTGSMVFCVFRVIVSSDFTAS